MIEECGVAAIELEGTNKRGWEIFRCCLSGFA